MEDTKAPSLAFTLEEYFVEHAAEAMIVLDPVGAVRVVNRAAFELLGVHASQQFDGSEATSTEVRRFLERVVAEGKSTVEIRRATDPGAVRDIAMEGVATETGTVIVIRDVTRLRALERELRQLHRVESAGLLTASIVHDLNNLLTPILCLGELIKHESAGSDTPTAAFSDDLVRAAERAAELVRGVLGFVRRGPIAHERVNFGDMLTEIRGLLERLVGDGLELSVTLDPSLGDVRIDQEQLGHVIINLVANARDAMPDGGGRITIAAQNATVPDGESGVDYVTLSVGDTGSGMPPEIRDRIFDDFFTTKEPGRGNGLGLTTAHRFVAEHGGKIAVESEPGRGTTVTLFLLRDDSIDSRALDSAECRQVPGGDEKILVVDSDDRVRRALRAVLEERGYQVLDIASGAAALDLIERENLDLVLADASLADLPAMLLSEKCRQLGLRAVFMSGRPDHELSRRGPEMVSLVKLRKAFAPEQLAQTVRAALDERVAAA